MAKYTGKVVFVDGVHYPATKDGHANLDRPLRAEGDTYRDAEDGDPLHNEANHVNDLELNPGGEG
jgi:hypothetical protein